MKQIAELTQWSPAPWLRMVVNDRSPTVRAALKDFCQRWGPTGGSDWWACSVWLGSHWKPRVCKLEPQQEFCAVRAAVLLVAGLCEALVPLSP